MENRREQGLRKLGEEKVSKSRKVIGKIMIIVDILLTLLILYIAYVWLFQMGGCPPYDRCSMCWHNITKTVYAINHSSGDLIPNLSGVILP